MLIAHTVWNNYYYKIQQVCLKLAPWGADWFQKFSEEPLSKFCHTEVQVSFVQGYTNHKLCMMVYKNLTYTSLLSGFSSLLENSLMINRKLKLGGKHFPSIPVAPWKANSIPSLLKEKQERTE